MREEKEYGDWDYMKKGLSFAAPHTLLILLAILMMLTSSAAQLILPKYDYSIINLKKGKKKREDVRF